MRAVLSVLLLLVAALAAPARVTSVPITRANAEKSGVPFTLKVHPHPDPTVEALGFELELSPTGKLERLDHVELRITEGVQMKLNLPVELRARGEKRTAIFHLAPPLAKRAVLRLVCPTPVRTSVTVYEVQVGTYLPPGKKTD